MVAFSAGAMAVQAASAAARVSSKRPSSSSRRALQQPACAGRRSSRFSGVEGQRLSRTLLGPAISPTESLHLMLRPRMPTHARFFLSDARPLPSVSQKDLSTPKGMPGTTSSKGSAAPTSPHVAGACSCTSGIGATSGSPMLSVTSFAAASALARAASSSAAAAAAAPSAASASPRVPLPPGAAAAMAAAALLAASAAAAAARRAAYAVAAAAASSTVMDPPALAIASVHAAHVRLRSAAPSQAGTPHSSVTRACTVAVVAPVSRMPAHVARMLRCATWLSW